MADNDDLLGDDVDGGAVSASSKKGGFGALLPALLKWVAIVIAASYMLNRSFAGMLVEILKKKLSH